MFNEDLSVFFAEFGVQAIWTPSGVTATVILDSPDISILGGDIQTTEYEILFLTTDFPGLGYDSNLSINGASYTVREAPRKIDDGVFSRAKLSKN